MVSLASKKIVNYAAENNVKIKSEPYNKFRIQEIESAIKTLHDQKAVY